MRLTLVLSVVLLSAGCSGVREAQEAKLHNHRVSRATARRPGPIP